MKTMKMFIAAVLGVVGASFLTQDPLKGLVKSGEYREAASEGLRQSAPLEPTAEDVYAVRPYVTYSPELPPGEGRDAVFTYCQICHSNTYIIMQPPLPAETWEAEVKKMVETHGASLPEDAQREIIAYLKSNFTPETRKK